MSQGRIIAAGPAAEVLRDGLLSVVYGCPVATKIMAEDGRPFVLPPVAPRAHVDRFEG
jgi:ABC-type hemin transport system ATPase subunit